MTPLQTHNLTVTVGKKVICQQLNVTLASQQIWGLLGCNGSGKTTLLHTLAGLRPPQEGEVWLQGKPIATYSRKAVAQRVGVLFQNRTEIFPSTVLETVLTGRHPHLSSWLTERVEDIEFAERILAEMKLSDFAQRDISTLSGGERQRLAFASVLLQNPQLYLLDEPANHLDWNYQAFIFQRIKHLVSQGATILMTLQDINHASRYCSHVILLFADGKVMFGPQDEILQAQHLSALFQQEVMGLRTPQGKFWITP